MSDLCSCALVERGEPAQAFGEALGRVPLEEQRVAVEQLVEHRVGREHGKTGRSGLVDDLVRGSRLHVVDEDVGAREQLWNLRTRHGVAEGDTETLEIATMSALEVVQRDPVELDLCALDLLHGSEDRLDPLRRRVASEHERPQAAAPAAIGAGELVHVDAVPDRQDLRRVERERAAVDGDDRGGQPFGGAQRCRRLPVRIPEQERRTPRTHERCG